MVDQRRDDLASELDPRSEIYERCSRADVAFVDASYSETMDDQHESYVPIKVLGRGAFGEAVLYRKSDDNSLVVWKEVNLGKTSEEERAAALNEVDILSLLDHINIVGYYNHFIDGSNLLIEMEYANGGSLHHSIVGRTSPYSEDDVVWYFYQLLCAVDYMHDFGIMHRDIKTLNIFLTKAKIMKLGDFGISRVLKESQGMAQSVVGTPYYMSPELVRGDGYNTKSDIWACGCVLYEMLMLKRVYDATNQLKLAFAILEEGYEEICGEYSEDIKNLLRELLDKDYKMRPNAAACLKYAIFDTCKTNMGKYSEHMQLATRSLTRSSSVMSSSMVPVVSSLTSEIYCWGGGRILPMKLDAFKHGNAGIQVATGCNHMAVVTVEKELLTWANVQGGTQMVGQLGHNDKAMYRFPKRVDFFLGKAVRQVACGEEFTVILLEEGRVYTCGSNYYGCIGCGEDDADVLLPKEVEGLQGLNIHSISSGDYHVVAMADTGDVFTWGCGEQGRLGLGSEDDWFVPKKVEFGRRFSAIRSIVCGRDNTFFLTTDGHLLACGSNENNKLALNQTVKLRRQGSSPAADAVVYCKLSPVHVRALKEYKVASVGAGKNHSAIIDIYGRLVTFGNNEFGQLGTGDFKEHASPYLVRGAIVGKKVVKVGCGSGFTVIATRDNHIYSWGCGENGRLGLDSSTLGERLSTSTPRAIFGSLHRVADIACRHWLSIALVEQVHSSRIIKTLSTSSSFGDPTTSSEFVLASLSEFDDIKSRETTASTTPGSKQFSRSSTEMSNSQSGTPDWLQHELDDAEFIPIMADDACGKDKPIMANDACGKDKTVLADGGGSDNAPQSIEGMEDFQDQVITLRIEIENLKEENKLLRLSLDERDETIKKLENKMASSKPTDTQTI